MTDLQRGIKKLEATRLGRTYIYYEYGTQSYYVVDSDDVRSLGRALRLHEAGLLSGRLGYSTSPALYSEWCTLSFARRATREEIAKTE